MKAEGAESEAKAKTLGSTKLASSREYRLIYYVVALPFVLAIVAVVVAADVVSKCKRSKVFAALSIGVIAIIILTILMDIHVALNDDALV